MTRYLVKMPIYNLKFFSKNSITIGGVKFFPYTNYQKKKDLDYMKKLLEQNPHYTLNQKDEMIKLYDEQFSKNINKSFAEVLVKTANEKEVYELGKEKINLAINVIKLYRFLDDDHLKRYFGIEGETIERGNRLSMAYNIDENRININMSVYGTLFPFDIGKMRYQFMKKNGIKKTEGIIQKKRKNKLDSRILSAITWYGESLNGIPSEDKDKTFISRDELIKKGSKGRDIKVIQKDSLNV